MKISASPGNAKVMEMMRQWPERTVKFMTYFTYLAAKKAHENILEKMPTGGEWRGYKRSLVLARVTGTPEMSPAYVIKAELGSRGKQREPAKEVIYVRPKRRRKKNKSVAILEKYGPWTWSTLPFTPSKRDAIIVTRKVREREMDKIAGQRNKDRKKWRRELTAAGARLKKRSLGSAQAKAKIVPDIAFEALRLEFGLGGAKSKSHWRPGIRGLVASGVKKIAGRRDVQSALTDPSFSGWKSWPPGTKAKSSRKEAKSFVPFQSKLGV